MSIGGTVTSGTAGSVLFIASGPVLAQDHTNFAYASGVLTLNADLTISQGSVTDIIGTATTDQIATTNSRIDISQTGGFYGTTTLTLMNENGMNGALFQSERRSILSISGSIPTTGTSTFSVRSPKPSASRRRKHDVRRIPNVHGVGRGRNVRRDVWHRINYAHHADDLQGIFRQYPARVPSGFRPVNRRIPISEFFRLPHMRNYEDGRLLVFRDIGVTI